MDEIKQVTVICTDTDKVFEGEIIREGKDTSGSDGRIS